MGISQITVMVKVSIIIPIYNAETYLRKCFDSIKQQTFSDYEVIAINDGSTDQSGDICDQYASMDKRFKVIHKKNEGVSIARNLGINEARGEYITFIDSDDWVEVDYLQVMTNAISFNCDLVVSGIINEFPDGTISLLSTHAAQFSSTNASQLHDLIKSRLYFGPCNKLYKTAVIKHNNITFPIDISYGEDRIFNYNYIKSVANICQLDYSGYHYIKQDSGTLTTIPRPNMFELEYSQWKELNEVYRNKGAFNQVVQQDQFTELFWIIHDNIFANRNKKRAELLSYIKKLLSTPEIDNIRKSAGDIPYNRLIKYCILNRRATLLWLLIQCLNLCKK